MFRHRTQTFRDRRALCCEESQKDIEIRGRLRSTRISFFEPFFCSERLKKPEFRLTLIGKLTLIDTKGNYDRQALPECESHSPSLALASSPFLFPLFASPPCSHALLDLSTVFPCPMTPMLVSQSFLLSSSRPPWFDPCSHDLRPTPPSLCSQWQQPRARRAGSNKLNPKKTKHCFC